MSITEKARAKRLEFFNLTPEDQAKMFEFQNGLCAICSTPIAVGRSSVTDHCHQTGLVRGMLCVWCNKGLGFLKDRLELLHAAVRYLVSPPATLALGVPRYGLTGRVGTKKARKALAKLKQQEVA